MCTAALYLGGTQESAGCIKAHSKKKKCKKNEKKNLMLSQRLKAKYGTQRGPLLQCASLLTDMTGAQRESKVAENTLALRAQRLDK